MKRKSSSSSSSSRPRHHSGDGGSRSTKKRKTSNTGSRGGGGGGMAWDKRPTNNNNNSNNYGGGGGMASGGEFNISLRNNTGGNPRNLHYTNPAHEFPKQLEDAIIEEIEQRRGGRAGGGAAMGEAGGGGAAGADIGTYNINLNWVTVDTVVISKLTNFIHNDPVALDCRRKFLSALLTADLTITTASDESIEILPEFNAIFQQRYKQFLTDAYLAMLVIGVVPVVLRQETSDFVVPVVIRPDTYILQTAFSVENERQYYRVLRPIALMSRPDRVQIYDPRHQQIGTAGALFGISGFNTSVGGIFHGGAGGGFGGKSFYPSPAAGCPLASSPIGSAGWAVDTSVRVYDPFGFAPSIFGEVRSPLVGVLAGAIQKDFLGKCLVIRDKMLVNPQYILQPAKEMNTSDTNAPNASTGGVTNPWGAAAAGGRNGSGGASLSTMQGRQQWFQVTTMGYDNPLLPLPDKSIMTPDQIQSMARTEAEVEALLAQIRGSYQSPTGSGGIDRQSEEAYLELLLNRLRGEEGGKLKFTPKGYEVTAANKHPEVHAGDKYFDALDRHIAATASAFEVPISLIEGASQKAQSVSQEQLEVFYGSIANYGSILGQFVTELFRDTVAGCKGRYERFLSIKTMEPVDRIDAENNQNPERYYRSVERARNMASRRAGPYRTGNPDAMEWMEKKDFLPEIYPKEWAVELPALAEMIEGVPDEEDEERKLQEESQKAEASQKQQQQQQQSNSSAAGGGGSNRNSSSGKGEGGGDKNNKKKNAGGGDGSSKGEKKGGQQKGGGANEEEAAAESEIEEVRLLSPPSDREIVPTNVNVAKALEFMEEQRMDGGGAKKRSDGSSENNSDDDDDDSSSSSSGGSDSSSSEEEDEDDDDSDDERPKANKEEVHAFMVDHIRNRRPADELIVEIESDDSDSSGSGGDSDDDDNDEEDGQDGGGSASESDRMGTDNDDDGDGSSGSSSGGGGRHVRIDDLYIRINHISKTDPEKLMLLVSSGAITPEMFQRRLCEGSNIRPRTRMPGIAGARINSEFLGLVQGEARQAQMEADKEDRAFERERETAAGQQEHDMKLAKMDQYTKLKTTAMSKTEGGSSSSKSGGGGKKGGKSKSSSSSGSSKKKAKSSGGTAKKTSSSSSSTQKKKKSTSSKSSSSSSSGASTGRKMINKAVGHGRSNSSSSSSKSSGGSQKKNKSKKTSNSSSKK